MAILINDTTPRSQYTATSGQTVFTVPFEFFENSDLKVYKNSTLLTLTTNYTVTGAGITGGGSVTLVSGATAGDILTIVRDVPVKRVTDFPTSGPFNVDALNSDLDRLTAMVQQQEALDGRSLRLDQFDTPNTLNTLPAKADRIGRVLQFNSSTGQPEAGPTTSEIANAQTYASNASTSATAAASSASSASTSASNASTSATNAASSASAASTSASNASSSASSASTSASNASTSASNASTSATAAAGSASTASTQASNASSSASAAASSASSAATSATNAAAAQTAAESARDATLAAYDNFDDRYLGAKTSDPSVDNDGNALIAGALYFNSTDGIMKLYTGSAWVAAYVSGAGFLALSGGALTGPVTSTVSSGSDAFRITQTGAGNALVVEDSTNPDATPFVINASGQTLIGAASAPFGSSNLGLFNAAVTANPFYLDTFKDRAGGIVSSGDGIHRQRFWAYDGASYLEAARFETTVDGTPGTNDMPGRFVFYTTADGASSPTERMRIDSSGNVGIGTISPASLLHLGTSAPEIRFDDDDATGIVQVRQTAAAFLITVDPTNVDASSNFQVAIDNTERFRIAASGQIGIGGANYGTSGQALVSNGSGAAPSWQSPVADVYTGSTANNTSFPIGTVLPVQRTGSAVNCTTTTIYVQPTSPNSYDNVAGGGKLTLSGTWRARGELSSQGCNEYRYLYQRTA